METLEELKVIIANAPKGSKFITDNGCYSDGVCYHDGFCWVSLIVPVTMRSLSDIKRIIELMEATRGLLQLTAGSPDGYWRNELNAARKALGYKV